MNDDILKELLEGIDPDVAASFLAEVYASKELKARQDEEKRKAEQQSEVERQWQLVEKMTADIHTQPAKLREASKRLEVLLKEQRRVEPSQDEVEAWDRTRIELEGKLRALDNERPERVRGRRDELLEKLARHLKNAPGG